jgi:hypothetical protein
MVGPPGHSRFLEDLVDKHRAKGLSFERPLARPRAPEEWMKIIDGMLALPYADASPGHSKDAFLLNRPQ